MKPIVIFLFALLVVACNKPGKPDYIGFKNLRVERIGLGNTRLAVDIGFYNPNAYALQLKSAAVDVHINKHYLGKTTFEGLINLQPKDTTYFPLQLEAKAKDLLTTSARILLNPNAQVKLEGNVKAGRGGFFVNVPVNYEGTQRLDLNKADSSKL